MSLSILTSLIIGCSSPELNGESVEHLVGDSDRPLWEPNSSNELDQTPNSSSSEQSFSWNPPETEFDHYEFVLSAFDEIVRLIEADPTVRSLNVSGLKSATEYSIEMTACIDVDCTETIEVEERSDLIFNLRTEEERWQFLGTGNSLGELALLLQPGSRSPSTLSFGTESVADGNSNRILMSYINEGNTYSTGIRFAQISSIDVDAEDGQFFAIDCSEDHGLFNNSFFNDQLNALSFTSAQFKPMMIEDTPIIRLFTTVKDQTGISHLLRIDSTDGLFGMDYNSSSSTICQDFDEQNPNVDCILNFTIENSSTSSESTMNSFERFQVGWELYESDDMGMVSQPFMLTEGYSSCQNNQSSSHIFGVNMEDSGWQMMIDENNCAQPLIEDAMRPSLVNYGINQMKLYYYSTVDRAYKLLYLHSDSPRYDLEQFEDSSIARKIQFLYPDGETLMPETLTMSFHEMTVFNPPEGVLENSPKSWMLLTLPNESGDPMGGIGMAYLTNP